MKDNNERLMNFLRLLDVESHIALLDSEDIYAEFKTLYEGRLGDLTFENFIEWDEMYYVSYIHFNDECVYIHLKSMPISDQ